MEHGKPSSHLVSLTLGDRCRAVGYTGLLHAGRLRPRYLARVNEVTARAIVGRNIFSLLWLERCDSAVRVAFDSNFQTRTTLSRAHTSAKAPYAARLYF